LKNVPAWMAENHVPCVGVGFIKDGRLKWFKAFGELQKGRPAPNNALFNIASQTKPVVAMLTLKLVQSGQWNLDEPLALSDTLYGDMVEHPGQGNGKGLGWGVLRDLPGGAYALQHGGSDIGVRTMAIFLPQTKDGIVVMTNGDNGGFVYDRIIKEALPLGKEISDRMNKGNSHHQRIVLPDSVIERYVGVYEQSNGKMLNIVKEGNAIKVSGDGAPTAVLVPETNNTFFLPDYDVQLGFPDSRSLVIYENGKQVMKINRKRN